MPIGDFLFPKFYTLFIIYTKFRIFWNKCVNKHLFPLFLNEKILL